jgi:hypothetical protein
VNAETEVLLVEIDDVLSTVVKPDDVELRDELVDVAEAEDEVDDAVAGPTLLTFQTFVFELYGTKLLCK